MGELRKSITVWQGIALAVSMVIGSGLLGLPGLTLEVGTIHESILGWILTIVVVSPLIYIFCKLGMLYTSSAGISKYVEEGVGKIGGFLVSAILCGTFTIGIPALSFIGAEYIRNFLNLGPNIVPAIVVLILLIMTVINFFEVKYSTIINKISLVALILLVIWLTAFNLKAFSTGVASFSEIIKGHGVVGYRKLWTICALLFWAFLGWENMSFGLAEFKNPKKSIPVVYWGSFILVSAIYLLLAFTSVGANINGVLIQGSAGLTNLSQGIPFGNLAVIIMILVIFANANAWVFGASRLIYSAGKNNILPGFLGKLSKNETPVNSLISLQIFYTLVIIGTSFAGISVSSLILLVSQNFLVLYGFCIIAYFKTTTGFEKWFVSLCSILSFLFLMSGFNWRIAYPVVLMSIGIFAYFKTHLKVDNAQKIP